MNEAETRAELIDPKLKACGWGVIQGSKVLRERNAKITDGKINVGGTRSKPMIADYILVYKGIKLAVVEAKSDELEVGEGVAQAKLYGNKLKLETTYSTNGREIYYICLKTGEEKLVADYFTPEELWDKTFSVKNEWREKFAAIPFEDKSGSWQLRYYQEIAVKNTLEAVAKNKERILLTLATGTGKTAIAFQIAWKLFQTRWNLSRDGSRRPRILFLADRNILADQAFNSFSAFPEDALVRISPKEISKKGSVPTNGSIFFTIFQTFMSGTDAEGKSAPYFGAYPADYFDFIIIDECHRGGANDESNWRGILEYFNTAVQLGLTATPKRNDNVDTYKYFGEPVYIYSLKEGINDGFLTPFKVKRFKTTLDDYIYTSDDQIIEGEIEEGKLYKEADFNRIIEIKAREAKRVQIYMNEANQKEKAIIFCATQDHASAIRDLVNQNKKDKNPNYCVRVTANDGEIGEQFLREFQDNEKTIPAILTTSQKLSTGVDARNIRNIVLFRPVNSMIEFKQIVGRGTRLFDGKEFFTIYDFVDAYHHFADPAWDGEPLEPETNIVQEPPGTYTSPPKPSTTGDGEPPETRKKIKIKLRDGKERDIQFMMSTSFWSADGKPISSEEFLNNLFGELPNLFKSEDELRTIWSNPITRKDLLAKLEEAGFGKDELHTLQQLIDAEKSDLFDVLEYVFNSEIKPISREARVAAAQATIFALLNDKQKEFIEFVLTKYIETGVDELDQEKLPVLLTNKYHSLEDAKSALGSAASISSIFIEFQKHLYQQSVA
ncbi:type I restriction enzyme R subunit [Pedobacter sp. CG_S7]|uniref:EcoAI/FtnUII family type I restriction enzme subunit R n=1 Tax=Pedobacter sp. CG_S7 TaxID=3143930 RepID=UPI00339A0305